jgi:hypothetical protein
MQGKNPASSQAMLYWFRDFAHKPETGTKQSLPQNKPKDAGARSKIGHILHVLQAMALDNSGSANRF